MKERKKDKPQLEPNGHLIPLNHFEALSKVKTKHALSLHYQIIRTHKGTLIQSEWMHAWFQGCGLIYQKEEKRLWDSQRHIESKRMDAWFFMVVGLFKKINKKVVGLAIQLACPLVLILGNGTGVRQKPIVSLHYYSITTVGSSVQQLFFCFFPELKKGFSIWNTSTLHYTTTMSNMYYMHLQRFVETIIQITHQVK